MITEYKYYYEGYTPIGTKTTLEQALRVKYNIKYIMLELNFEISSYIPAQISGKPENCFPEEGNELNVKGIYPMYIITIDDDVPVQLNKRMREIIGDYIDYDEINKVCYKIWEKEYEY